MAAQGGSLTLRRCTARDCKLNGMEACMGGSLQAEDCASYKNMQACLVREEAGPVRLSQVGGARGARAADIVPSPSLWLEVRHASCCTS